MKKARLATKSAAGSARTQKKSSLADQAYEKIKEKIINLYFLPGSYLNVQPIAEQLGLGRTPVHHALQRLHLEGLVEIIPRKGVVVQPGSIGLVQQIIEARIVIESEVAARAAALATASEINALSKVLSGSKHEHGGGMIDEFIESDRSFHAKLAEMCGNPILEDLAKSLHERSTRYWYVHLWQTLEPSATAKQHSAIFKAIESRNAKAAAKAMRVHLESLQGRLGKIQRWSLEKGR